MKSSKLHRKYWLLKEKRIQRDIRKRKKRAKKHNRLKSSVTPHDFRRSRFCEDNTVLRHSFPKNCEVLDNTDAFSAQLNKILFKVRSNRHLKLVVLDLTRVEKIDQAAIVTILTLINYLNCRMINIYGYAPMNEYAKRKIEEAGFFHHVNSSKSVMKVGKDVIFSRGNDKSNQNMFARQIENIVEHLTGTKGPCGSLYNILGEIQLNSIDHSSQNSEHKNWFMSFHYEKGKCTIAMADIGTGIINSLDLLLKQEFYNKIMLRSHSQILIDLFKGKYQSSTKLPNRNNGLPDIYDAVVNNNKAELTVITNKAFLDISGNKSRNLSVDFPGTFYLIKVTKQHVS